LSLEFVGPTAEYLADVHVKVARVGGETVFETVSAGPLMLVKLPPGTYKVSAQYKDRVQSRTIQVKGRGAHGAFKWATE
jgi:UDP-N-acetylglucosamine:LPS N-acetylglucosamine transferase